MFKATWRFCSVLLKLASPPDLDLLDLAPLIFFPCFLAFTLTCPIHVTLGDEGSGFSKPGPLFLLTVGNMGEAWPPPLMLPLLTSLLLKEDERDIWGGSLLWHGLNMDLEESFMDEERHRWEVGSEVK